MIVDYGDVKVYSGSHIKEICQYLLDKKMYVEGWSLKPYLVQVIEFEKRFITKVAIKYKDGNPVGLATRGIMSGYKNFMMCYVKDEFRNSGVGSELVNRLKVDGESHWAYTGYSYSVLFWESLGVVPHTQHRSCCGDKFTSIFLKINNKKR
ncbi:hypothetical protein [Aeromonas phage AS-yj]|uniref:N-acetyltransferase domain-containing protein n=1 Tax=Aeromonas phage AS-yj TaxID=2026115 RepID=A0A291LFE2_9CAUD|nr:hypothetical protein [Aeromonas phage AS-yj]